MIVSHPFICLEVIDKTISHSSAWLEHVPAQEEPNICFYWIQALLNKYVWMCQNSFTMSFLLLSEILFSVKISAKFILGRLNGSNNELWRRKNCFNLYNHKMGQSMLAKDFATWFMVSLWISPTLHSQFFSLDTISSLWQSIYKPLPSEYVWQCLTAARLPKSKWSRY